MKYQLLTLALLLIISYFVYENYRLTTKIQKQLTMPPKKIPEKIALPPPIPNKQDSGIFKVEYTNSTSEDFCSAVKLNNEAISDISRSVQDLLSITDLN